MLIAWLVSTIAFAITTGGPARALALVPPAGLVLTLVASGAFCPQRRLVATALALASLGLVAMTAAL
ncbi:MAG: hypothetical protein M3304_07425 [Actinomycetota bacterium]|nr:hypothetical protein [Actinomycetota bacterium]